MSDEERNPPEEEMSFADMLAAYDDGRADTLNIGDKVNVKIISIGMTPSLWTRAPKSTAAWTGRS